jgi:hypothetical protein
MIEFFPFGDSHADRRNVFLTEVKTYRHKPAFILGLAMWAISLSGLIGLMVAQNWWLSQLAFLILAGVHCFTIVSSLIL